jgi:LPS sulfotransferase NodH
MQPQTSYLICTTPRCGSWLLSEALQATEIAGRPREYFAPELHNDWLKKWHSPGISSFPEFIAMAVKHGTTSNGVFGCKVHWYQFQSLLNELRATDHNANLSDAGLIQKTFPNVRYIWLFRRDKVRQAVSYYRASRTGQWWNIASSGNGHPPQQPQTVPFDFSHISKLRETLLQHESNWRNFFSSAEIQPQKIAYEELAQAYDATTVRVLESLNIDLPPDFAVSGPRLKRQADSVSEDWSKRYRRIERGEELNTSSPLAL